MWLQLPFEEVGAFLFLLQFANNIIENIYL